MSIANLVLSGKAGVSAMTAGAPVISSCSLSDPAYYVAWIFPAEEDATITALGFRYNTRVGIPPEYVIAIEGVDASGLPDGVVKGGGTPAQGLFTPPNSTGWNGTWRWIALDNSYNVSRGQFYAIVIRYSSGTCSGSAYGNFTFASTVAIGNCILPYAVQATPTVTKRMGYLPHYGYMSASRKYGNPLIDTAIIYSLTTGSSPDEAGLKFTLDALGASYTLAGIRVHMGLGATGNTVVVNLYDTDGTTVLQTVTLDTDAVAFVSVGASYWVDIYFDETNLATLSFGSTYRIGFVPQGAAQSLALLTVKACDTPGLAAFGGGGTFAFCSRTDAGAWTDVASERPRIDLILGAVTPAAGGGGGLPILGGSIVR